MRAQEIIDQRAAGLITDSEARDALERLQKQSEFNAAYSEHPRNYARFTMEAAAARRALTRLARRSYAPVGEPGDDWYDTEFC